MGWKKDDEEVQAQRDMVVRVTRHKLGRQLPAKGKVNDAARRATGKGDPDKN